MCVQVCPCLCFCLLLITFNWLTFLKVSKYFRRLEIILYLYFPFPVRWWNPGVGEVFRTYSCRPWGLPSLLYSEYRASFPGVKRQGLALTTQPHLAPRLKKYFCIIKPTRCTNSSTLFLEWNCTCFGQFLCPSSGVFHCTHRNGVCHTVLQTASCQQTCTTYTVVVCTVENSWWWTEELSETCRISFRE